MGRALPGQGRGVAMEFRAGTPASWADGDHRVGDVGKVGARSVAARSQGSRGSVELHYLTAALNVLFDRIRQRGLEDPPMQFAELRKYAEVFQTPSREEMALFDVSHTIDTGVPGE